MNCRNNFVLFDKTSEFKGVYSHTTLLSVPYKFAIWALEYPKANFFNVIPNARLSSISALNFVTYFCISGLKRSHRMLKKAHVILDSLCHISSLMLGGQCQTTSCTTLQLWSKRGNFHHSLNCLLHNAR